MLCSYTTFDDISSHLYAKSGVDQIVSIPVHRDQDLKIGTLKAIMKVAQLSEDDLH